jgi:hypothetical protein
MLKSNKSSRKLLLIRILALFSIFISCSISECIRLLTPGSRNVYTDVMKEISIFHQINNSRQKVTSKTSSGQNSKILDNLGRSWPKKNSLAYTQLRIVSVTKKKTTLTPKL